jgi:hypothetical protein
MCLDAKAMRSWRAHKGWATRRRREAEEAAASHPLRVGLCSHERSEGTEGLPGAYLHDVVESFGWGLAPGRRRPG